MSTFSATQWVETRLYVDATDCTTNMRVRARSTCIDFDDGSAWFCNDPTAGGDSPVWCDDPGDWTPIIAGGGVDPGDADLSGIVAFSGTTSPAALSGNVDDYAPVGLSTASSIRINGGAGNRNITGLTGGESGRIINIINIGASNNLVLKTADTGSSSGNRFLFSADVTLLPNDSVSIRYDAVSSRWRLFNLAGGAPCADNSTGTCLQSAINRDPDLVAGNVRTGTTIYDILGTLVEASIACANDASVACTLNATRSISDAQFLPENIRVGTNILNVAGTLVEAYTTCSNDTVNQCSLSATRSNDDAQFTPGNIRLNTDILNVTGTLVEAYSTCTNDISTQCSLSATRSNDDAQFLPGNIKSGVDILNVTGTYVQAGDITTSLYGYWKLNESSGTSGADASGNSHPITLSNTTNATWMPQWGIDAGALYINGGNDYLVLASPALSSNFTLSLWTILPSPGFGVTYTLAAIRAAASGVVELGLNIDGSGYLSVTVHGIVVMALVNRINPGQYTHLAVIRNGTLIQLVQNGVVIKQTSYSAALAFSTCSLYFGMVPPTNCVSGNGSNYMVGVLENIQYFQRALSSDDLALLYATLRVPANHTNSLSTSLHTRIEFDEPSGTSAADTSGNSHTATLNGGAAFTGSGCSSGNCVSLDGTDDYINIPTPSLPTGDYTYYIRVTTTDSGTNKTILQSKQATGTNVVGVNIQRTIGNNIASTQGGSALFSQIETTYPYQQWVDLVLLRLGKLIIFYIDGYPVFGDYIDPPSVFTSNCDLLIGVSSGTTGCAAGLTEFLSGKIDKLVIFSRAISPAEVLALHAE